ncbi:hypothetical protein D0869_13274 [Hortaea werneckii]|uniref:Bromo domain-containing protein n=1 Tax=Hortaea werneckii TaxID=91943 RepID=A0A3M6ZS07_HORWE|nr:hypothetical protein KC334_g7508 [Hortaea werneckii]RMX73764.1 hypothetical protein D0869_13274 [Hortaea werneckii]RMX90335.1 hypothetical protein D0868_14523 [Hortaea werneckii]RMX96919.1 hypothetical protein D0867_12969 [Hortaea werneckii]RMY17937.1 hypothetical protein D0866_13322 [Hortaea werneckii]
MPSYTALESLLLFQALRADGCTTDPPFSFNRIADQLKAIPLVRNDPSYNEARLTPDALRDCYLGLVKEEAKKDLLRDQDESTTLTNGEVSPGSRKRKAPSPTIPTVQEAAKYPHLIPRLVERLYQSYRDHTISQIREQERLHERLSRDIEEITAGAWDDRLLKQRPHSATQSPRPSIAAHSQIAITQQNNVPPTTSASASPVSQPSQADTKAPAKKYSQASIDAVMNHGPEPQSNTSGHRRTSSNTQLPPLSEMAPHSPRYGIPSKVPPMGSQGPAHAQHQQRPSHPGYAQSPTQMHHSPYTQPAHVHAAQSPQLQNSMSRSSASPRPILPPPPGMHLPPHSPVQHSGPPQPPPQGHHMAYQPSPAYAQPHRSSVGRPAQDQRPPPAYPSQGPHTPGYYTPIPPHPPYQNPRMPYQPQPSPQTPGYAPQPPNQPQRPGRELPPFSLDPAQPGKAIRQPYVQQPHPAQGPPTQASIPPQHQRSAYPQPSYRQAPATAPRAPPQQSKLISNILAGLATPPRSKQRNPRPLWKNEGSPAPSQLPHRPEAEPLSPVQRRAGPIPTVHAPNVRDESSQEPNELLTPDFKPSRPKRTRHTRGGSPGSTASSKSADLAQGRTRSHSASTATGEQNNSRADVKREPSTPAEAPDRAESVREPSATPASGPMTRKRRGTLQSSHHQQPPSKRKRQQLPQRGEHEAEDEGGTPPPPPRPNTILAPRNFAKVASAMMNDIASHKHAVYFSQGVRDKDANGYSDIIKQPQHLKSIRAAITAGTRAVNAGAAAAAAAASSSAPATSSSTPHHQPPSVDSPSAAAASTTPSSVVLSTSKAPDGSTTFELERSVDLLPPKAIVNAAQLEKEVYRMFANAVMFNPGEDGLVADTREMFADVEKGMREWRGAESSSNSGGGGEGQEEDGGGGVAAGGGGGGGGEEQLQQGKAKRRKL